MLPSRRKTHLYCNPSCGCLQAITMQIQSATQSQSAKIQQAKHWLSQLHASHSPHASPHLLKQLQHTTGKHTVASAFSVQTVRPVLHSRKLQGDQGPESQIFNLPVLQVPVGTLAKSLCFTTSVAPLALGSSPAG